MYKFSIIIVTFIDKRRTCTVSLKSRGAIFTNVQCESTKILKTFSVFKENKRVPYYLFLRTGNGEKFHHILIHPGRLEKPSPSVTYTATVKR